MATGFAWTQKAPKRSAGAAFGFSGEVAEAKAPAARSRPAAAVASTRGAPAPSPMSSDDPDVDPLDAFMAGITAEISKPGAGGNSTKQAQKGAASWEELESEDPVASYCEAYEHSAAKKQKKDGKEDDDAGEDAANAEGDEEEDGDRRNKAVEPMPPVDHSAIEYATVRTDFYKPHPDVAALGEDEVTSLRRELGVSATGTNVPHPVAAFGHLAQVIGKELMEGIRRHRYVQPTPIQAQAIPAALGGQDVIGIAKTGSGKTMAYLIPMLVHAMDQPALERGEGPIGLVLCPTRELAVQIEQEVFKFNKLCGLRSVTLAGGLSKQEQFKEVKRGCEIAICNPGRLIDIVRMKGVTLQRVTLAVLDEADRMFDMGFEYQVRSIMQNVRPQRQTLLFSATFPPRIERLAREILRQPVRITVGEVGQAAENISQHVAVLDDEEAKWGWLSGKIDGLLAKGQLLIFAKSIASAQAITANLKELAGKTAESLHGDLDQNERMRIMTALRKQKLDIVVATDVAARGLDITTIRSVVSYDVARDIETHTHRIGRTGRAGAAGDAYTLLTGDDSYKKMAAFLVESLEVARQPVSDELRKLAMRYAPFRASVETGKRLADCIAAGKAGGGGGAKGGAKGGKAARAAAVAAAFET
eukprot:TRINITY_DN13644_c0_g1_i1.p1 TRINITY_DN13644_c0_g1~~TRINITY_DN13644_c0_g1_i1.p1  ORF type:complete len:644 (-),score=176.53 TRINITY_DN13644_c0_g1_i1:9-1940(-)